MDPITIGLTLATQFAPSLIKWMTGSDKAEQVAQKAIEIAKEVTGTTTGDEAIKALQADPNLVLAYRKAVLDQELEFRRIALAETQAYIDDTQDARKYRDDKTFWLGISVLSIYAVILLVVILGLGLVLTGKITMAEGVFAAVTGLIGAIVSRIDSNAQQVIGFFFGSSKGSSDKTDAMAEAIKGLKR